MTQDEIIRMFHEAGELAGWKPGVGNPLVIKYLTRFAALVAAHEREECAEVCDRFAENETGFVAEDCAAAIRARNKK